MSRGGGHRTHARSDTNPKRGLCGASSPYELSFGDDFLASFVDCKNCQALIDEDNLLWRVGVDRHIERGQVLRTA